MTNGDSFLDLSQVCWEDLKRGHLPYHESEWLVDWKGRQWVCKRKEDTLSEIIGYQLAQLIGLPLQPWVAFYQTDKRGCDNFPCSNGMLIEFWPLATPVLRLESPIDTHRDLVCKALVICALDRGHDPEWLTDADQKNLRLSDLEGIGPKLIWPLTNNCVTAFKRDTHIFYQQASELASKIGLEKDFDVWIDKMLHYDFAGLFDFSGHPHGRRLEQVVECGLAAWQSKVRRILRRRGAV